MGLWRTREQFKMSLAEETATSRDLIVPTSRLTQSRAPAWPILVILLGLALTIGWIITLGWIAAWLLLG
jgi:hypothetical protein